MEVILKILPPPGPKTHKNNQKQPKTHKNNQKQPNTTGMGGALSILTLPAPAAMLKVWCTENAFLGLEGPTDD